MFAMSRRDLKDAYRCGEYHKRGLKGCTSHHIRVDKLDEIVKLYVQKVKDNSSVMLDRLNAEQAKEREDLEETYDELESDLLRCMEGIQNQLTMAQNKRNTIIRVNRVAKTALEVFDDILRKPKLDRNDLNLIIEKIRVFEDHIEVQLKADVDSILRSVRSGTLPEELPAQEPEAAAAMAAIRPHPYEI